MRAGGQRMQTSETPQKGSSRVPHPSQSVRLPRGFVEDAGMPIDIGKVGVVGAGTMGNGIAQVFARKGYDVVLLDLERSLLERGLATISKNIDREVAKGKASPEEKAAALKRIVAVVDRGKLAECDVVVE